MKPELVKDLAAMLGWPEPEFFRYTLPPKIAREHGKKTFEWAECHARLGLKLQINCMPRSNVKYTLCVYALRFRICSGWRGVKLHADPRRRQAEIDRILPYYEFANFTDANRRKAYRLRYPYVRGYTAARISAEGTLHFD